MQTYIDLSTLPKPKIIEELDIEGIFNEALNGFKEHLNKQSGSDQIFDALLASDPAIKLIEYFAYREFLLRQRINDAFAQTLLAYARGNALDHMAAAWNISRGITEYNEKGEASSFQSDDDLRALVQLAPERITTAGSKLAYIFHALNLGHNSQKMEVKKQGDSLSVIYHLGANNNPLLAVRDAGAHRPKAGHVHIAALSYADDGYMSDEALNALDHYLNGEFIRPLTDYVTVQQGINKDYTIHAKLELMQGVDPQMVLDDAKANIEAFVQQRYRLGETASIAGIYDAIHTSNVRSVRLIEPEEDQACLWNEAPRCIDIVLEV